MKCPNCQSEDVEYDCGFYVCQYCGKIFERTLEDKIDYCLKEYGVDWKLEDKNDPDGKDNYYKCLLENLMDIINKEMKK